MSRFTRGLAVGASVLVLGSSLAACGGSSDGGGGGGGEKKIAFIQGVAGDQFYITMQCGAQDEAAKLGVKVNTQGPQKLSLIHI